MKSDKSIENTTKSGLILDTKNKNEFMKINDDAKKNLKFKKLKTLKIELPIFDKDILNLKTISESSNKMSFKNFMNDMHKK